MATSFKHAFYKNDKLVVTDTWIADPKLLHIMSHIKQVLFLHDYKEFKVETKDQKRTFNPGQAYLLSSYRQASSKKKVNEVM